MATAIIFGATGGIGSALARQVAGEGRYRLVLSGRRAALSGLAQSLGAEALSTDLGVELEVHALFELTGPCDLLIYAAGAVDPTPLREMTSGSWQQLMDANLTGAFYALKHARFNPGAQVVLLGVYPEFVQAPRFGAYAASKAGLEALAEVARKELRRDKVGVTLVRLPAVETGLWQPLGKAPKGALDPKDAAAQILDGLKDAPPVLELGR